MMCGITGWVHFQKDLRAERNTVAKMTDTLAKRGPDDENVWSDTHVSFGHRRLTVVDPDWGKTADDKGPCRWSIYTLL